jgi:hypothetical protein
MSATEGQSGRSMRRSRVTRILQAAERYALVLFKICADKRRKTRLDEHAGPSLISRDSPVRTSMFVLHARLASPGTSEVGMGLRRDSERESRCHRPWCVVIICRTNEDPPRPAEQHDHRANADCELDSTDQSAGWAVGLPDTGGTASCSVRHLRAVRKVSRINDRLQLQRTITKRVYGLHATYD